MHQKQGQMQVTGCKGDKVLYDKL